MSQIWGNIKSKVSACLLQLCMCVSVLRAKSYTSICNAACFESSYLLENFVSFFASYFFSFLLVYTTRSAYQSKLKYSKAIGAIIGNRQLGCQRYLIHLRFFRLFFLQCQNIWNRLIGTESQILMEYSSNNALCSTRTGKL